MMSIEVIDDNNKESDDASIDLTNNEENNIIDEDDSDEIDYCLISFYKQTLLLVMFIFFKNLDLNESYGFV